MKLSTPKAAILLFVAVTGCYLSLSPGTMMGRGYVGEEMDSGLRMLEIFNARVKHRPTLPMLWSRHGSIPVLFDLPFIKLGKTIVSPDFMLSFVPILFTAGLITVLFCWLRKLCSPGVSLLLTLTAAFGTMLWPYAYIGLETKQSFFLLLSGYLALSDGKIQRWPRLVLFAVACGLALTVKSVGIVLCLVIAHLIYVQFRDDWRGRWRQLMAVMPIVTGIWVIGKWTSDLYWNPYGGGVNNLTGWMIRSPFQAFTNAVGLFGSPAKGLFVFAPALILSLWAAPQAFRLHRDTAVFSLLVVASTVAFISTLVAPTDEVWGPRFLHILIAPLFVCIGAAWPRFQWQVHAPLILLAVVGLTVSFFGALYYYGERSSAAEAAGQNTMEWLTADNVWSEAAFNSKLFSAWLQKSDTPVLWTALHIWVWSPPQGATAWKTIDLRAYSEPQSFMLSKWHVRLEGTPLRMFRMYVFSLIAGLCALAEVVVYAAR
jgi:hypothetical protein